MWVGVWEGTPQRETYCLLNLQSGLITITSSECFPFEVQRFAGWLAQICNENSHMHRIFNSKSSPKVCAA